MQTIALISQDWTAPAAIPSAPRLYQLLFGFAFCISSIVLVEPAPVDALMLLLLAIGVVMGTVRLAAINILPVVLLAGLALANVVSISLAVDPARAVWYFLVTFYLMLSWALCVGALDVGGMPLLQVIFRGYSFAAFISVVLALASYFHLIGFQSFLLLYGRPKGLFKDPNVYGPFLVPIAVMAITGCLPIASRFWQACMAVVASMGIALSYSRACWINYVVSLALFVVLDLVLPTRSPEAHSVSLSRVFLFGAVAVLAGLAILQVPSVQSMLAVRLGQNGMHDYDQTRFQTQRMAVQAAIDHPLGIGPGQSEATFQYATHSSYMRVLSENGLFGLCCFVGFAMASVIQAVRKACLAETAAWRGLFVAAAACICGQLINSGVVDTVHWRHFWILLALPWIPARVWSSGENSVLGFDLSDPRRTQ
jgi:hypothetical protein